MWAWRHSITRCPEWDPPRKKPPKYEECAEGHGTDFSPTCKPAEPEGGKVRAERHWRKRWLTVSKFNKSCKPAEAGCSMNPEHKLHKTTGRHVLTKSLNTCDEAAKEKRHITLRGKVMRETVGFSLEISKKWGARSLKCWKKESSV